MKESEQLKKQNIQYFVNQKKSSIFFNNIDKNSSDKEKAYAINQVLNDSYFVRFTENFHFEKSYQNGITKNVYSPMYRHFYKLHPVFSGENPPTTLYSYSSMYSMLAWLILYCKDKSDNENEMITCLREAYNQIVEFAKDDSKLVLQIKNCNRIYQTEFKEMVRHILVSDKDLPKNIDIYSLKKVTGDLTYEIYKKN